MWHIEDITSNILFLRVNVYEASIQSVRVPVSNLFCCNSEGLGYRTQRFKWLVKQNKTPKPQPSANYLARVLRLSKFLDGAFQFALLVYKEDRIVSIHKLDFPSVDWRWLEN